MKLLAQIDLNKAFFNGNQAGAAGVFNDPGTLINRLLPNALVLAGLIFFVLILGGGFAMIRSAGGESNSQSAAKAKAAVTFALIGFLIVISAYFILQLVQTITGVNFINPGTL